jgi:muramidase (phage lysozyme)
VKRSAGNMTRRHARVLSYELAGQSLFLIDIRQSRFASLLYRLKSIWTSLRLVGGANMLDITLLSLGLAMFVASVGYAYLCKRL